MYKALHAIVCIFVLQDSDSQYYIIISFQLIKPQQEKQTKTKKNTGR